jgi:hypothetical protein
MVEISTRIEPSRARSVDRLFDFIFFGVENAAICRYEVAKGSKISTYLVTISGHLFFGVIQKESTSFSWNFDLYLKKLGLSLLHL